MNTSEAKERLVLYRGSIDDADPQFEEALAHARRDPELAEWVREQRKSYDTIRSKLREIEPPSDLAEKIIRKRPIPFRRGWTQILKLAAAIIISASITAVSLKLWQRESHRLVQGKEIVVKGEVLDMTCYIAYNMSGPEHAGCARDCIKRGLPVGIKATDGKVYLLVGTNWRRRESLNSQLAEYAAKTVTIRGKETMRDGFAQLQVEEIRKS
ncbi:MAG: hypothetical protein DMF22_02550 [Verrucomicrobia bacterium]|nr:MAG: hypothetical protein DME81_07015 [Verrucomicrobiota bacterium]PYJ53541.1 MAG: hypothetical protein DME83_02270 [Verrucomicrobiota bacterium]PYJ99854.1 MAG: hypothetical protein DME68_02610 [Verrucomicrobiota bacterium]PYL73043.1 MAG: hypothetical protein DMF22_02550 [Verrucomicrobiota bacterium]